MDPLLISAASGMKARQDSLDILANNLANSNTAGYKADREYNNLYESQLPWIENRWTDFSQGSDVETGNPLDLSLWGKGFFALNGATSTVYTRNGSFRISKANQLVSQDGMTLRNALDQGRPVVVDPTQPVTIDKSGIVTQGGQQLGRLQIDQMPGQGDAIAKLGTSYFALTEKGSAQTSPDTEVIQGHLEQSNVPVSDSAVRLINIMRQFEMLQRAVTLGSEMNRAAIEQVARVN